ncbi:MAG: hypothetical protein K8F36_14530 [Melioribacteraceae bacterium]|nr:hypothetical protein [Melioribacteraceae bacterium]MCO6473551.1 hypothetical protein [Melioribacteraceae bacterium]
MKENRDYIKDLAEIRSMMERSSKFLSLSGWAGIMAGLYALAGVYIAYNIFNFNPTSISSGSNSFELVNVVILAIMILTLALVTAIFFSYKKAKGKGEDIWNPTSRRLLKSMLVPLLSGGILIILFLVNGFIELILPLSLIFYGLSLYNAGKFTIDEVKLLGFVQIGLGLLSSYFIEYGLIFWAIGFGVVHIIYGIYMHFRYER